jgi:LysR family transcriptional regulator, chromosome initiation inhibitor
MSLLSAPLQAFVAIVQQTTVHGAAKQLNLTQTGVTQRVRALESELKTTLFLRSRRGMKLTAEGEALLRYCKGATDLEGQALSQMNKAGLEQPIYIDIAGPTSVMTSRIVNLCSRLYAEWPQLNLNFVVTDVDDRVNLVRSGKTDLAIVPPEQVPNEMDSKLLKPEKYILVASQKWKGRKLIDILENEKIIDFDKSDQTSLNYLKKFGLLSKMKKPRLFANDNEAIIKLFSHEVGFGTLTLEIAKPHLDSGQLISLNGGAVMDAPLALTWYPRPAMPRYFRAIVDAIK